MEEYITALRTETTHRDTFAVTDMARGKSILTHWVDNVLRIRARQGVALVILFIV